MGLHRSKSMTKAKREFGYSAGDAAPWAIRVLTGKFGKTPRDYASSQGHTEVAARLLKAAGGGAKSCGFVCVCVCVCVSVCAKKKEEAREGLGDRESECVRVNVRSKGSKRLLCSEGYGVVCVVPTLAPTKHTDEPFSRPKRGTERERESARRRAGGRGRAGAGAGGRARARASERASERARERERKREREKEREIERERERERERENDKSKLAQAYRNSRR